MNKKHPQKSAKLLYECGPNWTYATNTSISDPALFYQSPTGTTHIVVNELEYGHLKHTATVDKVHSFTEIRKKLGQTPFSLPAIIQHLHGKSAAPILVPATFPAALYDKLKAANLPVQAHTEDLFFPARALKTAIEIKHLRTAQKANEAAFTHAFEILKAAKIRKDNTLLWQSSPLTAEILQSEMNSLLVKHGCLEFSGGPIVACGAQGAVPHERGHGPLKAHQLIVIDCFPRHKNNYWGDLTRTVVKGKPSDWQKHMYFTVLEAQKLALSLLKPKANGAHIHAAVEKFFQQAGFPTGTDKHGNAYGFFHGTGHGVGLELHDAGPRTLSKAECILKPGMVTSVEPGLYYPSNINGGVGGVRIEDVVVITETGHKNLTTLSKTNWIIP